MPAISHTKSPLGTLAARLAILGLLVVGIASCKSPKSTDECCPQKPRRAQVIRTSALRGDKMFTQVSYEAVVATVPKIPDAEFVKERRNLPAMP